MRGYLYLIAIIIVLIAFGYWANSERIANKKIIAEKQTILTTKERLFTNQLQQHASEVKVWSIRYNELEAANEKNSEVRSDYEQKLAQAYKDIELYKRKNKDLEHYISFNLNRTDTIYLPMQGECYIPNYKSKFLDIDFIFKPDSVKIIHDYRNRFTTLVTLFPKKKSNGKNHWPNWGFIWGYDTYSIITSDDPRATVSNQVSIKFKK